MARSAWLVSSMLMFAPIGIANAQVQSGPPSGGLMSPEAPVISLSVTESVDSAPDMATIMAGVETRAPTAKEAMAQNAAKMDLLIKAVVNAGVDRKDIRTTGINLNPQYDYSERRAGEGPRFLGYQASNMVTVNLRKLDKAGETVDALVAAGATNINGPTFDIEDNRELVQQARAAAVKTAQERADFYAKAAGFRSARLISIDEGGNMAPPPIISGLKVSMAAAPPAPPTPVEPGQLSTSITLSFRYMLER